MKTVKKQKTPKAKLLTNKQFVDRLVKSGWKRKEAQETLQRDLDDASTEDGM